MLQSYEEFSEKQEQILKRFVTNTDKNVFVLRNLPEVIKGALFSRYSRSSLGLRSLLLKEFIGNNEETAFTEIVGASSEENDATSQSLAIQKAQNFYDRILDGYGDDSIGELGGAHLATENISMLAAKVIEDCRIGGSPLEKSTRYVYFDQKINGEYLFYHEPVLMTSAYRELYLETCNELFETYAGLIPSLTALIEQSFPYEEGTSKIAYKSALRAKVLDCIRGLLPASTLTNMGVFGNGRFFDGLIHKLHCHSLTELQELGKHSYDELAKVVPSFVRRADVNHRYHQTYTQFTEQLRENLQLITTKYASSPDRSLEPGVRLVDYDAKSIYKVAAAFLFPYCNQGLENLKHTLKDLDEKELLPIFEAAAAHRTNRRHKSPRALEESVFTFEIIADFGVYRDLQRHRMLSQERQFLSCDYGYYIPKEIVGTEMEQEYIKAMEKAKDAYERIACELPEEAQYIVPMAYNIRWYFTINLRSLQWLCELRSAAAGHTSYRFIAQSMAKAVTKVCPAFECFFKFVDYDGYDLGRLDQEQRTADKKTTSDTK